MKRVLSFLLSVMIVISAIGSVTFVTALEAPLFEIESVTAKAGESVDVNIAVKNNPGIASIKLLLTFDKHLTLNSVEYNTDFGGQSIQPETFTSPVTVIWLSPFYEVTMDGNLVKLNFTVDSSLEGDYIAPLNISYDEDDVYNIKEENVFFSIKKGSITVESEECKHINKTFVSEKESSCIENGNDAYYVCDDCGQIIASDGTTEVAVAPFRPLAEHKGGTATCTERAKCSVCGNYYGDFGPHSVGDDWTKNSTHHMHICKEVGCNTILDFAPHSGGVATCTQRAVCEVCGEEYGSLASHTLVEKVSKEYLKSKATEDSPAVYYKTCEICGFVSSETFQYGNKLPKADAPYIYGTGTMVLPGREFTVNVEIKNNPGINYLVVEPVLPDGIIAVDCKNGNIADGVMGVMEYYVASSSSDKTASGTVMTFTFKADDDIAPGYYQMGFEVRNAKNKAGKSFDIANIESTVEVVSVINSDANADGRVTELDFDLLMDVLLNTDDCYIRPGFDLIPDGVIDVRDVVAMQLLLNR